MTVSNWQPKLFVTPEVAAAISGTTAGRIWTLIRRGSLPFRGSLRDPLVPLGAAEQLRQAIAGAAPGWVASVGPAPVSAEETEVPQRDGGQGSQGANGGFKTDSIVVGNVLDVVRDMPSDSVQAVVTSPPFWGQRVYADETTVVWRDGSAVPLGREATPEAYVAHTLEILSELARVLKPRGTIWWNIGDTYMTRTIMHASSKERIDHYGGKRTSWAGNPNRRYSSGHPYLKDKDLTLVPFHIAMGAQLLGYWVRSLIIWSKQHPQVGHGDQRHSELGARAHMPEPVLDRPVVGHEYILLLAREREYDYCPGGEESDGASPTPADETPLNVRSVWSFRPADARGKHGARFPDELPRRCISLGSREGDLIFDPFAGEGTTLRVARELGRRYFGCDISPSYVEAARAKLNLPIASMPLQDRGERPSQPSLLPGEPERAGH